MKKYLQAALIPLFLISASISLQAQDSLAIDYNKPDKKGKMYVHCDVSPIV